MDGYPLHADSTANVIGSPHGLIYEEDGSVIIHISRNSPGVDREANWLPSGDGKFVLTGRYYDPLPQLLQQRWSPPEVLEVGAAGSSQVSAGAQSAAVTARL